jgi:Chromate transporter
MVEVVGIVARVKIEQPLPNALTRTTRVLRMWRVDVHWTALEMRPEGMPQGLAGLLAATVAINAPHCLLTYFIGGIVAKATTSGWVRALKEALVPVTTGLILGGGVVMARATDHDLLALAISAVTAGYVVFTSRNPLWALAVAALAGIARVHLLPL